MGAKGARLIIAGLSGDAGKTLASLTTVSALRNRGRVVAVFKKGPDYIDAAWLGEAAQNVCRNLDTYMVDPQVVLSRFTRHASGADIAIIEGNRGLFDGFDVTGTHSTASLAKLLHTPVILVVDATKTTRTVAAMIKGCQAFDPDLEISGIILNRVAGKRHQKILTDSISEYCGVPVVGVFPKLGDDAGLIPGRHLGLVTPAEFERQADLRDRLCHLADQYLDLEAIEKIAAGAPELESVPIESFDVQTRVKIGYFCDSVFTFYYPENLESLRQHGAELVPLSSLDDTVLPDDLKALYIGGGFPETQAERLAGNRSMLDSVREKSCSGLPIYAECGGLIYLCRSLACEHTTFKMAGVFELDLVLDKKPRGHGYAEIEITGKNPYFTVGDTIRGHEFHYSGPTETMVPSGVATMKRGIGLGNGVDGLLADATMATYTHLHADGAPGWARAMVKAAENYSSNRKDVLFSDKKKSGIDLADDGQNLKMTGVSSVAMA